MHHSFTPLPPRRRLNQLIESAIRSLWAHCWNCTSIFCDEWGLCFKCGKELEALISPQVIWLNKKSHPIPCYTLFNWNKNTHPLIRNLLYYLKGRGAQSVYVEPANFLLCHSPTQLTATSFFVPVPSSNGKIRQDHAYQLATALAQASLNPMAHSSVVIDCLETVRVYSGILSPFFKTQKNSSYRDRKKRQYRWRDESLKHKWRPIIERSGVCIVDDVVVTGSSALATFEALGFPKNSSIWALAYREI
jgi:predicted amidophosphoribosyltransferase